VPFAHFLSGECDGTTPGPLSGPFTIKDNDEIADILQEQIEYPIRTQELGDEVKYGGKTFVGHDGGFSFARPDALSSSLHSPPQLLDPANLLVVRTFTLLKEPGLRGAGY
jgi:hypothetical protein